MNRRGFCQGSTIVAAASMLAACEETLSEEEALALVMPETSPFFKISLAQWSLHRDFLSGKLKHLDFAAKARALEIDAVEYVSTFFADKANDASFLQQMNTRAADHGVEQLLIMVDLEGALASPDSPERNDAIENHRKWVRAAHALGCHSIRVNLNGGKKLLPAKEAAVASLTTLSEYAAQEGINVLVENHGGFSSNAQWLASVMHAVALPNCGTLPDFGNFRLSFFPPKHYNPYKGTAELMPFAKGVSAKTYAFRPDGTESSLDYVRLLRIVKEASYTGHIGIEYEGFGLAGEAGILATKALLLRSAAELG